MDTVSHTTQGNRAGRVMRSISRVSNEDGEKLRLFEKARQDKIRTLLNGATIADVFFDEGNGLSGKSISGLTLVKSDEVFHVSIEANTFYDVIESSLQITGKMGDPVENMITMKTPCDDCIKEGCATRSKPGEWVVACKDKP